VINASAVIGTPHARQALPGPADVVDDELPAFVAAGLGVRHATVLTSSAAAFSYDGPAITTAGRYLVTGSTRTGTGQISQIWIFGLLTGTEPTSVQNGGYGADELRSLQAEVRRADSGR